MEGVRDEGLVEALRPHCWEGAWAPRLKRKRLQLQGSIRNLQKRVKLVKSYKHVCQRLHHARLGVSAAKLRSGKCDYCHSFDTFQQPRIAKVVAEVQVAFPGEFRVDVFQ